MLQINVLKTAGQNGLQIFSMSVNYCHRYSFIDQTLGSSENIENDGSSPQKEMVFCVTFQASSVWISTDTLSGLMIPGTSSVRKVFVFITGG